MLDQFHGKAVIADAAYDSDDFRFWLKEAGLRAVICSNRSRKRRRPLNRTLYRLRYNIECFFHRIKTSRAIATRYEKSARNYLALLHLVSTLLWLD